MPDSSSQIQSFLSEATRVVGMGQPNPDAPLVPFQTDLKLTRDQEKRMIEHAFKRLQTLNQETGRETAILPNWWQNAQAGINAALASQGLQPWDTFFGKRSRYDATFANDVSWRPYTTGPDSIFYTSNIPVPAVRRVARQTIARAQNAFYGADPWLSIQPAPVVEWDEQNDRERADRIEKFIRFKLGDSQSDSKAAGRSAIRRAFVVGECAVKTSYVIRDQIFNVEAEVLHSVEGYPILAADGNFITRDDEWVGDPEGSEELVLKRDNAIKMPLAPIWQRIPINRRQVLFEGTRSEPIYYKDFLCPLTARDVQTADCIVHLYDKPVMEFVDLVVKRGMVNDTSTDRLDAATRMLATIKKLASNSPQPKAAAEAQLRPNDNFSYAPYVETGAPVSEFAEFYMWFDANGDGIAENIMLICDRQTQAPIFYDHVANVTTDGLRPIEIVRAYPVEDRWYGVGIMELFESYGTIIDLLVNRWNFSQSRSGRVDFWRPTDTQEGDSNPNLRMNWGSTYTAKPGVDPEKILHSVYLTDIKFDQLRQMFEFFLQMLTNESGVSNANDAQTAGLASSDLATGIMEIQQSGDELFDPFLQELKPCLQRVHDREVDVTLANMNPQEAFTYLEGDTMGIDKLTPDDVRGLKFKTVITLKARQQQKQIQVSGAAAALVEKFYQLSPLVQERVAEFYRQQVRALDPRCDVNKIIQPIPPTPPAPEAPKKAVSVTIKGEHLTPEQRDEVLREDFDVQAAGAQPQPLEDVGSMEKPGEGEPNTDFQAQLSQRIRRKAS